MSHIVHASEFLGGTKMVADIEYALMAGRAYASKTENNANFPPVPSGWTIQRLFCPESINKKHIQIVDIYPQMKKPCSCREAILRI